MTEIKYIGLFIMLEVAFGLAFRLVDWAVSLSTANFIAIFISILAGPAFYCYSSYILEKERKND